MPDHVTTRAVTSITFEDVDFEVVDHKNRRVGTRIMRAVHEFRALDVVKVPPGQTAPDGSVRAWARRFTGSAEVPSWHCTAPGVYYVYEPHATRDGDRYGASNPTKLFESESDCELAIAEYLKDARARALRKFRPSAAARG